MEEAGLELLGCLAAVRAQFAQIPGLRELHVILLIVVMRIGPQAIPTRAATTRRDKEHYPHMRPQHALERAVCRRFVEAIDGLDLIQRFDLR